MYRKIIITGAVLLGIFGIGILPNLDTVTNEQSDDKTIVEVNLQNEITPDIVNIVDNDVEVTVGNDVDTLVVYFSVTETTKEVAEDIAELENADIFRIEPITPYTLDDAKLHEIGLAELRNNERPEIKDDIENIEQYDTIYVGFPIWWSDMPAILYTFFDEYILDTKAIMPFATSTYSGLGRTIEQIQKEEPLAYVKDGLILTDKTLQNPDEIIIEWIENNTN